MEQGLKQEGSEGREKSEKKLKKIHIKIAQKSYGQENIEKQRGQEGRQRKKKTENKVGKKEGGGKKQYEGLY